MKCGHLSVLMFVMCTISTCSSEVLRSARSLDTNGSKCGNRYSPCCSGRDDSCKNNVGTSCFCDEYCTEAEDCCSDYTSVCRSPISDTCLKCICNVESGGCKPLDCRFDINGDACGYFQIHYAYYIDCHKPKPAVACSNDNDCWEKCSKDYNCASRCVRAYMARYKNRSYAGTNCESYARLHNGGPNGANKRITRPPIYDSTTRYWNKVKAQGCSINS